MGRWFFGLVLLALLAVGACTAYWELTATRVGDVERLLDENLPRGSTTEEIVAFLDSRDIPHHEIERCDANLRCHELQGAGVVPGTMTFHALIEDTRSQLGCVYRIHIQFILDDRQLLQDYIVWETSQCF
jgi:hypothetical protein